MNKGFYFLLGFAYFVTSDAIGQVFKCTDKYGKISYLETPCASEGKESSKSIRVNSASESDVLVAKERLATGQAYIQKFQQGKKDEETRERQYRAQIESQEKQAKFSESLKESHHVPDHFDRVREIENERIMRGGGRY